MTVPGLIVANASVAPVGERCPRCGGGGAIALLTSLVAYYVCVQCAHRWQLKTQNVA